MNEPRTLASIDTNVITGIVRGQPQALPYLGTLDRLQPMLTFFVQGELNAGEWSRERQRRLDALLQGFVRLDTPSETTLSGYVAAVKAAQSLGIHRGMGTDLWIIAQTRAEGLAFVSHDSNAVRAAARAGLSVITYNERASTLVAQDQAEARRLIP